MYYLNEDEDATGEVKEFIIREGEESVISHDEEILCYKDYPLSTLFNLISIANESTPLRSKLLHRLYLIPEEIRNYYEDDGESKYDYDYSMAEDEPLTEEDLEELPVRMNYFQNNRTVEIPDEDLGISSLTFINSEDEPNNDNRGTIDIDCTYPWTKEICVHNPTYLQVLQMFFAIKSHKWDRWYELFGGAAIDMLDEDNPIVEISFGYGS